MSGTQRAMSPKEFKRNRFEHYGYIRDQTKEPDGFIRRALDIGGMAIIR
jgi:hypothetical protein